MCSVASVTSSSVTPWTLARQAPLSIGFSEQEYWSGFPCLPPGGLQDSEIKPASPVSSAMQVDFFFFFCLWASGDTPSISMFIHVTCFPDDASGKEPACQCRRHERHGFDPWVGKMPWRRKWQPIPVFLPGESHGQRSLAGYTPWGHKESDMTKRLTHTGYNWNGYKAQNLGCKSVGLLLWRQSLLTLFTTEFSWEMLGVDCHIDFFFPPHFLSVLFLGLEFVHALWGDMDRWVLLLTS